MWNFETDPTQTVGGAERFLGYKAPKSLNYFTRVHVSVQTAGGQTFCTTENSRIGYRMFQVLSLRFCFLFAVTLYFNLYIQYIVHNSTS